MYRRGDLFGDAMNISIDDYLFENPMEVIANKSDFLISLCEVIVGGKYGCLAPASRRNQGYTMKDLEDISSFEESNPDRRRDFASLSAIRSVPEGVAKSLLLNSVTRGFITNKCIRDTLGIDVDTADRIVSEFQNAGYISTEQGGNHRFPTTITFADFVELLRECR